MAKNRQPTDNRQPDEFAPPSPEEFSPRRSGAWAEERTAPDSGERVGNEPEIATEGFEAPVKTGEREAEPVEDEGSVLQSTCVLMGPSNSGKTTLINAMDQACSSSAGHDSRYRLEFLGGPGTSVLSEEAVRTIMEPDRSIDPTDQTGAYEASITATESGGFWRPSHQDVAHLVIRDGPGGALFPSSDDRIRFQDKELTEWEEDLIRDSRQASTIMLCVDATEPWADRISIYLRNILAALAMPYQPEPETPLGYRMLRRLNLTPEVAKPQRQRRISAKRFLLLFTKIDRLVSGPLSEGSGSGQQRFPGKGKPTPRRIAAHLSPLQVASQCIGEVNLLRILNSLKPGAEFAVGLSSAWGFDPETGQAFMEGTEPLRLTTQTRQQRLLAWRPFGVREALLFIVTGCTEGPVELVQRKAIRMRRKGRYYDIASASNGLGIVGR